MAVSCIWTEYRIRKNFHMSWFVVTMSWGVAALILNAIPFKTPNPTVQQIFRVICIVIWAWNGVYWFLFLCIMLSKFKTWIKDLAEDPVQPLFCGCAIMGFAIWLSGFALFFDLPMVSWYMWWVDVAAALVGVFTINFRMFNHKEIRRKPLETLLLLPALPTIVAAATGASLVPLLPSNDYKQITILTCYGILGIGLSIALCFIAVYLGRLFQYGRPPNSLGNSTWIPIGPIGHGANTILQLARYSNEQQWSTSYLDQFAKSIVGPTFAVGFFMWGFGVFLLGIALMTSISYSTRFRKQAKGLPFNLGYWAMIFPLATLTFCTYQLTIYTEFMFFYVFSWIFGLSVVLGSTAVHVTTIYYAFRKPDEFWGAFTKSTKSVKDESSDAVVACHPIRVEKILP